jgi:4-hydroxy-tetrahydrodipicolinate synthase
MVRLVDWMVPELRLPMTPPSAASCAAVDAALVHAGLI